ncbi:hypothetical protein OS242_07640 [Tumebacillus sp. DT12]|uniref:Uncharacterized protein n=1 Tax=Tumebacillus lacus TaxID=2995335 RepID=A0ABT3WYT8_9BACL|nr:hypothetical protein [Tumebacillus lacus]MCX7569833.1 hypothetical protein [Tumebacillus lacus]
MAVTFVLANSVEESVEGRPFVQFEEELHTVLYQNREYLGDKGQLLVNLDPYNHKVLTREEIVQMTELCQMIPQFFEGELVDTFTTEFSKLCAQALATHTAIVALGD